MRFIIGGNASGKLQRVYELGYQDSDILYCKHNEIPQIENQRVLYKLNTLIDTLMKHDIEPKEYINSLMKNSNIEVIVCDEVGCGVVPMQRYERDFRECVGRISCLVATNANSVERIYCGIATVIKSDES
ncbi:bifunctional adenosylcobinamide kinase/adenosylcobinamide-phosphate guanylyltransferase [Paludicola sp. MB14-C6]|uniref:bifunctional adenosylcobinamide kinase/adenosylcobinamide-phosphate guanylyltransferase n=1 Tax=Paludihabitans sp. MB14-C6 TaxID=3070656 RepID=UPI0027DC3858|nr:bifunctional adenosylcobinamide kinase/adenosylcobinamide-phosphate guanylyltransferase [Paludicola sp. MB14-C6]WMJ22047.1 bifunctional adenosylcobinamide kinase/adenosylcobinamide-phosphate guanylyltransferase [Paludicola sp. MB14-C6]